MTIDGGLGVSRTWQVGSGVLVLQGNVSNEENLAAVQVKVGDQGYIDAQFGVGLGVGIGDGRGWPSGVKVRSKVPLAALGS